MKLVIVSHWRLECGDLALLQHADFDRRTVRIVERFESIHQDRLPDLDRLTHAQNLRQLLRQNTM